MKVCTSAKFANFCPGLIRSDKHVTEHCTREGKHLHNDSDKTFAFEKKKTCDKSDKINSRNAAPETS